MQNDLPNKKLSILGIASETNELELLRNENERLKRLLEDKEKELQIVKKNFEDIINSRIAINPINPIDIVPYQIIYPTTEDIVPYQIIYPATEYPFYYSRGSSAAVDFNYSSQSQLSFSCSSNNAISNNNCSNILNHNDNTFLNNDSCKIFQIHSNENDDNIISLTG